VPSGAEEEEHERIRGRRSPTAENDPSVEGALKTLSSGER